MKDQSKGLIQLKELKETKEMKEDVKESIQSHLSQLPTIPSLPYQSKKPINRMPLPKRLIERTKSKRQQRNAEHKRHSREQQALFVCCLIGMLSGERKKTLTIRVPPKFKKEGVAQSYQVMKIDDIVFPERPCRTDEENKVINAMSEMITKNIPQDKMKKTYSQPDRVKVIRYDYIYPFVDEETFYQFGRFTCEFLKSKMSSLARGNELILDEKLQNEIAIYIQQLLNHEIKYETKQTNENKEKVKNGKENNVNSDLNENSDTVSEENGK